VSTRTREEVVRELATWAYEREANYSLATVTAIVERAFDAGRLASLSEVVGDIEAEMLLHMSPVTKCALQRVRATVMRRGSHLKPTK